MNEKGNFGKKIFYSALGCDFSTKEMNISNQKNVITFIDVPGGEEFFPLNFSYLEKLI